MKILLFPASLILGSTVWAGLLGHAKFVDPMIETEQPEVFFIWPDLRRLINPAALAFSYKEWSLTWLQPALTSSQISYLKHGNSCL